MNSVQFAGTIKGTASLSEVDGKPVHDSLISVTEYEGTTPVETLVCARIIGKKAEGAAKAIKPNMIMSITGRILKGKTSLAGEADFVVECRDVTLWPARSVPQPDPAPAPAAAPEPAAAATPEPVPAEKPAPKPAAAPKGPAAPRGPVAAAAPATIPQNEKRPW